MQREYVLLLFINEKKNMKISLYLIISICSKLTFAIDSTVFDINYLFNEIITSKKFYSWNAVGDDLSELEELHERLFLCEGRYHLFSKNYSPVMTPINKKPVVLNENSKEFFNGIEDQYFDGSYVGLKYCFFPQLILNNEELKDEFKRRGDSPYFFYLVKKSSDLNIVIAPNKEEEENWLEVNKNFIKPFQKAYLRYISNVFFNIDDLDSFKDAIIKGHLDSIYLYACMLYLGKIEKDLKKAREYFKLAADNGHMRAQYYYACMLYLGQGGKKDLTKARKYFELATENGHKKAMFRFAFMLFDGEGGEKNLIMASEYFRILAVMGDPEAQFNYALMIYNNQSLDRDLNEAKFYFGRSMANKRYKIDAIFYISMIDLELRKDELKMNNKRPYPFDDLVQTTKNSDAKRYCPTENSIGNMNIMDFDG